MAGHATTGDVIAVSGPLGIGKTVLARGFIHAYTGQPVDVTSPTFTLVHVYDQTLPAIWHVDLFRLESHDEIEELGLDEVLATGITLIEWPEKAAAWLPQDRLDIELSAGESAEERTAMLDAGPSWTIRLEKILARA